MTTCYPIFTIRDWTLPPQAGSLESFLIYHEGHEINYKRIQFREVLEFLLAAAEKETVYVIDLHLLFACLLWHNPLSDTTINIYKAIANQKIISVNDLTKVTESVRGWKALFERRSITPNIIEIAKECESMDRWLLRTFGEDRAKYMGAHIETLGRSAALIVTWNGVCIDRDLLKRGHEYLTNCPTEDKCGQLNTLNSHYKQVYQSIRSDGRSHPIYNRLATFRFGSFFPNIQNFTGSGDEFSSKKLVISEEGKKLVGYDLKLAELHSLAYRWSKQFGDSKLLTDLNSGLDLHAETGKRLFSQSNLSNEEIRTAGKVTNFAILNLSGVGRINENLSTKNIPSITQSKFNEIYKWLTSKYPLAKWHADAKKRGSNSAVVITHYGRRIRVRRPQQYTGYQFQSVTGDATAMAALELILSGYRPHFLIHDEVCLSLDETDVENVANLYIRGFRRVLPDCHPKVKTTIYDKRWSDSS